MYCALGLSMLYWHPRPHEDVKAASTSQGPAFALAILSDDNQPRPPQPHVRQQFFSNIAARSAADVNSVISSLRLTMQSLAGQLHSIVRELLKKARFKSTLTITQACIAVPAPDPILGAWANPH